MRPIIKQIPRDFAGNIIYFSNYQEAKSLLVKQLGDYCSFCEKHNTRSALHVEHIYPKSKPEYAHLENDWDNFLLACVNCNSIKQAKDINVNPPYMPHTDNLLCYIEILYGGLIQVKKNILAQETIKANAFMELVGLNRDKKHPNYSEKDDRWQYRYETYNIAHRQLSKYENRQTDIENILSLALSRGFFSVWFTIFQNHKAVKVALIQAFSGTANCFDQDINPIPRTQNDL